MEYSGDCADMPGEPLQLPLGFLLRFLGKVRLGDLLRVLGDDGGGLVHLAQLLLDGLHLLAEEVLALVLLHLLLCLGPDLLAEAEHFLLVPEVRDEGAQLLLHRVHLQELLRVGSLELAVGGDQVREVAGIGDGGEESGRLVGDVRGELHDLASQLAAGSP